MRACSLILAVLAPVGAALAGSLVGADLQYAHISGLTWSFTVTAYVDPNSPADMPHLLVSVGGGGVDTIPRVEPPSMIMGDCFDQVQVEYYAWQHTFSGPGVYTVMAWKGTRIGTLNLPVVPDNTLCLSTEIIVSPGMPNSSPVFGAHQRTSYYAGDTFVHDPEVTDPDGDSLSFSPLLPRGFGCMDMISYTAPSQSTPEGDLATLDPATGIFQWIHPNTSGVFSVVMRCTEWRDGSAIGSVVRDMTVCLEAPFTGIVSEHMTRPGLTRYGANGPVVMTHLDGVSRIQLHDMRGALIDHLRPTGASMEFPLAGLPVGTYQVVFTDRNGRVSTDRFVIAD